MQKAREKIRPPKGGQNLVKVLAICHLLPTYSDEVHNNIYLIYSEEDDSVIGTQIMYFKKRSLETLKKYLPRFLFDTVEELKLEVEQISE